ncbi:MAG TPA: YWFCY domain-containing protein [Puia sp.]|nr:YWFCY domain-containing protein [Puia sp.]
MLKSKAKGFRDRHFPLAFLALSVLGSRGRKNERISAIGVWTWILCGLALFFASSMILPRVAGGDSLKWGMVYMSLTMAGFLMAIRGSSRLSRLLQLPWSGDDRFGSRVRGFPQEERRVKSDFGLYLSSHYKYQGKVRNSVINFINPRRGILIMGSPGSGKSWLIIEPLLRQLIGRGMPFLCMISSSTASRGSHGGFFWRTGGDTQPERGFIALTLATCPAVIAAMFWHLRRSNGCPTQLVPVERSC